MAPRDAEVAGWLAEALDVSTGNLPRLPGLTVIACDNSGSMSFGGVSERSTVRPVDVASLLGAIARELCDESILLVFGSELAALGWTGKKPALVRAREIAATNVGHATFAFKVPRLLRELHIPADRLLMLTDMQVYGERLRDGTSEDFTAQLRRYRREIAPRLRTTIVNLSPDRRFMTPPDEHGVTYCAGFSEGILELAARDGVSGVRAVEAVSFADEGVADTDEA
jgi:hypothetical protein